jgi:Helix-turn-helix domain
VKSYEATRLALRVRKPDGRPLPPGTARVLVELCGYVGDNNGLWVYPSQDRLAEVLGITRRTVRGHLAQLEKWNLIERRHRRAREGYGRTSDMIHLKFLAEFQAEGSDFKRRGSAFQAEGSGVSSGKVAHFKRKDARHEPPVEAPVDPPEEEPEQSALPSADNNGGRPTQGRPNDGGVGDEGEVVEAPAAPSRSVDVSGHPAAPAATPTERQLARLSSLCQSRGIEEELYPETREDASALIEALEAAKTRRAIQAVRAMAGLVTP